MTSTSIERDNHNTSKRSHSQRSEDNCDLTKSPSSISTRLRIRNPLLRESIDSSSNR